jgi:hypothetical protein
MGRTLSSPISPIASSIHTHSMMIKWIFLFILAVLVVTVVAVITSILWHKMKYPEKSYTIAYLNTILAPLRWFNLGPFIYGKFDHESMMDIVMKETKLTDFGDLQFIDAYRSINTLPDFQSQRYTNLGYLLAIGEVAVNLTRRLKMMDYLKHNPTVVDVPIRSPIFIFGLGRSGTTFLHRLLSLDPKVRSPRLWELVQPVPSEDVKDGSPQSAFDEDRAKRKEIIRKGMEERLSMGEDGLEKYHEIGHDLPEECIFGLSDEIPTIFHYSFNTLTNWEKFREKVTSDDLVRAYQWYKKILQLLSFQTGDRNNDQRWVLKCPLHIFMIPELAKAFPDAKLVWYVS